MPRDHETHPAALDSAKSSKTSPQPLAGAALAGLLCVAAASGCSTEKAPPPGPGMITSSQAVASMTADDFTKLCDDRGGTVEVMPHCGGFATAKGFSYDTTNGMLSEHTCKGANTCGGWNCAIED